MTERHVQTSVARNAGTVSVARPAQASSDASAVRSCPSQMHPHDVSIRRFVNACCDCAVQELLNLWVHESICNEEAVLLVASKS